MNCRTLKSTRSPKRKTFKLVICKKYCNLLLTASWNPFSAAALYKNIFTWLGKKVVIYLLGQETFSMTTRLAPKIYKLKKLGGYLQNSPQI